MNRQELYALLDIENGNDFQYFENVAELLECEEEIETDLLYGLISEISLENTYDLLEEYFSEIEKAVPDGETDFYMLLTNIRSVLGTLIKSIGSEEDEVERSNLMTRLAEEIAKFRAWYSLTPSVECTPHAGGPSNMLSVRDALGLVREEKLGGNGHSFDFQDAMEYELSDLVMRFSDLLQYS